MTRKEKAWLILFIYCVGWFWGTSLIVSTVVAFIGIVVSMIGFVSEGKYE